MMNKSDRRDNLMRMRSLAAGLFWLASAMSLFGQEDKLAPDLAGVGAEETVDVIIQLVVEPAGRGGARRGAAGLGVGRVGGWFEFERAPAGEGVGVDWGRFGAG